MKPNRFTLGTKLFGTFVSMIVLILLTLTVYLASGRQSHAQLESILDRYNKKMEIGTQVELATTEMQGAQRGLMLSYAMQDPEASQQYKKLYVTSGNKIDALMAALQPLQATNEEKNAGSDIRDNRAAWAPRFEKLIELCEAGKIPEAYTLRNENKVISAKMHAAATELVHQQNKSLEAVKADSLAAISQSNWLALGFTVICMFVSVSMFVVLRREIVALRSVATDLDRGANELANASQQVTSSSQSVAEGASRQASLVEETSAAAEQISAMSLKHDHQLRDAGKLTETAGQSVNEANRALADMHSSMREINTSCEKVGKIIRVIDEIAFQTNILALNAAVESARAGEAGLGFAVVADEVRNLAQRSAKAASETAHLIEESIAKSKQGLAHLTNVSGAIAKVTGGANQIASLVDDVKTGSSEQSRGSQQIVSAMVHIEQVTQSAAAVAEQTAGVGEEMHAQADSLNRIVHQLRVMVG